jgi:serine protease Do
VLTNWHVVRDATGQISVTFPDGYRSAATVLKTDETWDLAALLIWRPDVKPVTIATEAPARGDRLTIAGYGSGKYRQVSGKATQYVSPGEGQPYEMVEVDVAARSGDSGGPILNSQGQLAGVLFGSADGSTNGSHSGRVRWFLKRVLVGVKLLAIRRTMFPNKE